MDSRERLISDAEAMLERLEEGFSTPAPSVMRVPAATYSDPGRFDAECRAVFRRVPLMLAASCEVRDPGDFKTMEIAGIPLLIVRGKDGVVRTLLNACTHRGAILARDCGKAARFTCPYHAWTFGLDGALLGIASRQEFGEVDTLASRLVALPTMERAGLVWAILDPAAPPEFDAFLGGFDRLLEQFGFAGWHHFKSRHIKGANWKLAFDAHLEFYHLPVLHRDTFGSGKSNMAEYFRHGPHQRLGLLTRGDDMHEQVELLSLSGQPKEQWPIDPMLFGEWIIFPNISINSFTKGGRCVIISQVLPGASVDESVTVQMFLYETPPEGEDLAEATALTEFLGHVVGEEDMPMSVGQQRALNSGLLPQVQFGRNEGGLQHFHQWLDRFVEAPANMPLDAIITKG